jgi:hypothetical protein
MAHHVRCNPGKSLPRMAKLLTNFNLVIALQDSAVGLIPGLKAQKFASQILIETIQNKDEAHFDTNNLRRN